MPDSDKAAPDIPTFAPALASLFVLSVSVLLRDVLGLAGPGPGPAAAFLIVVSSGVCRSVAGRFAGSRTGTFAQIRAFVITLIVSYTVISLTRSVPFAERFVPDLLAAWRLFLVVFSWALTIQFLTPMHDRHAILRAVYAEREGERRQQVLRDMSELTAAAMRRLRATRSLSGFMGVLLVALALGGWAGGSPPSSLAFVLVALYAITRYLAAATIDTFLDEYRYIGEGNRLPGRYRRRRMRHATTLILSAAILALPLTSTTSILPPELLAQAIDFLGDLIPTLEADYGARQLPRTPPDSALPQRFPDGSGMGQGNSGSSQWVLWLLDLLERLAIIAIVGGLALFLLAPLWSEETRRSLREKRWKEATIAWLSALRYRLGRILKAISLSARLLPGGRAAEGRRGGAAKQHTADTRADRAGTDSPPDGVTKKSLERASRRFKRLERWARKNLRITRWPHEAPGEFAERIANARPDIAAELQVFAARYERALFGATVPTHEVWNEMDSALRTIVRSRPPGGRD